MHEIRLKCRRCREPFLLKPGLRHLSDHCPTCSRLVGKLSPERLAHLNSLWANAKLIGATPDEKDATRGQFVFHGRHFTPKEVK